MPCPGCNKLLNALNAVPHCPNKACTWTRCHCGVTYDRAKGNAFNGSTFYPAA